MYKMATSKTRGRPSFVASAAQRQDIRLFKADNWSDDRIARRLGISRTTLLKHFAEELESGADQERQEALRLLKRAAKKLNVTAIRELLKIIALGSASEPFLGRPEPMAAAPKIGKKEQAIADAQRPDTTTEIGELMARRGALH